MFTSTAPGRALSPPAPPLPLSVAGPRGFKVQPLPPVRWLLSFLLLAPGLIPLGAASSGPESRPIATLLREPLPAEELTLSSNADEWIISGPTFEYRVQKKSGTIGALNVKVEGEGRIQSRSPADIQLDDYRLAADLMCRQVVVLTQDVHQIVLQGQGVLRGTGKARPDMECTLRHAFFDDGVVVSNIKLTPREDWPVEKALGLQVEAQGLFSHYLHKRRDEHGENAVRGPLPPTGETIRFRTLTSCLQVFSPNATLAAFTDCGATFLSRSNLDTASVMVSRKDDNRTGVRLCQYLVQVAPGDKPYVLKGGESFSFRVGLSLAPNRKVPPRMQDLRMFAWIGDAHYPYPTDREIEAAAQAGYTLFQMHRVGTPGEPRPPAGELERVIRKVHDLGMLFLWTENADLMYDSAPGVQALKAKGQWPLWQGFNFGGTYKATMDPYCDLVSTCLASPNGLAEYRLATIGRMLDRFAVDGIYLDDNLAYPNCTLWREHGHPRPVYDCLIDLHQINWQRRRLLRQKCPHLVLVSHNTRALVLPVLCDFDAILYGEGYSFGSLEQYWDLYRPVKALPAQGMIWPGGQDPVRCAAAVAYNYDLLTGGGQYCYIDWRLFPKKFPYGAGVTDTEHLYVQTYNLAQYYFGLYESQPFYFADSADLFLATKPQTYATLYRNQTWGDWLIALANMGQERQETSLDFRAPHRLGFEAQKDYVLFDIVRRTCRPAKASTLNQALQAVDIPAQSLRLFCLRPVPAQGAYHLWGGKRIAEQWDGQRRKLTLRIQGPPGLMETLVLGCVNQSVQQVQVNGNPQPFFFDVAQRLVHGQVTFTAQPLLVEVTGSTDAANALPESLLAAGPLAQALGVK